MSNDMVLAELACVDWDGYVPLTVSMIVSMTLAGVIMYTTSTKMANRRWDAVTARYAECKELAEESRRTLEVSKKLVAECKSKYEYIRQLEARIRDLEDENAKLKGWTERTA